MCVYLCSLGSHTRPIYYPPEVRSMMYCRQGEFMQQYSQSFTVVHLKCINKNKGHLRGSTQATIYAPCLSVLLVSIIGSIVALILLPLCFLSDYMLRPWVVVISNGPNYLYIGNGILAYLFGRTICSER